MLVNEGLWFFLFYFVFLLPPPKYFFILLLLSFSVNFPLDWSCLNKMAILRWREVWGGDSLESQGVNGRSHKATSRPFSSRWETLGKVDPHIKKYKVRQTVRSAGQLTFCLCFTYKFACSNCTRKSTTLGLNRKSLTNDPLAATKKTAEKWTFPVGYFWAESLGILLVSPVWEIMRMLLWYFLGSLRHKRKQLPTFRFLNRHTKGNVPQWIGFVKMWHGVSLCKNRKCLGVNRRSHQV